MPFTIWPAIQPNAGHPALARRLPPPHPHPPLFVMVPVPLVRPHLGRHRLLPLQQLLLLRHRRLRRPPQVRRPRRRRPRHPSAVLLHHSGADLSSYDVSLVDGFNVPMIVTPHEGKGRCSVVGCRANLPGDDWR
ncbi:osmotin-like protein [Phtheirospermum japonicum]|uniref:Osmotin-like protein n=1 Tax=Phtheirospermum japonicum TaxID=374723 RepID=A0A830CNV4_9LAMI|nr:osmotin-like protein [Phtheirospermum japonicum]